MDSLLIAHKTANAISAFCLLLLIFTGLDLVLPRVITAETVQGSWREKYNVHARYSGPKMVKADDREFLVTENHEIAVDLSRNFSCSAGDVVEIATTPLFGFVREVYLLKQGEKKQFERDTSLLGNFIFLPYALLFTAVVGLINHRNPQQAINYASGSLVLLLVILWMMRVF